MVGESEVYLTAMGMTGEGKLDAEFGSAIERVWIVRKQDVRHVAADQRLDIRKGLLSLAAARPFALVIDADEVEGGALESNLSIFVAQQFHAGLRVVIRGFVFRAGVDFVVAVAAPDTQRSTEAANIVDAIGDGITAPGDEITGDHG